MEIAESLGADAFYKYLELFKFQEKTGIDLPGEASGIFHSLDNIGPVELATMSFGQSFQITPVQLLRSVSAIINGGYEVTPHIGVNIIDENGEVIEVLNNNEQKQIVSTETSNTMKEILEEVVYSGTGNKTYIPGYRVGGKTATSEKLPRGNGKYIASFLAFAPADDPQVVAIVLIDEPVGAYYGGQIAGPVMQQVLSNTLPYLGVEPLYYAEELELEEVKQVTVKNFVGLTYKESKKLAIEVGIDLQVVDNRTEKQKDNDKENEISPVVVQQMPRYGEIINQQSSVIIYIE